MKRLFLLFFIYSAIIFSVENKQTNNQNETINIPVKELKDLKSDNEMLRKRVTDLEENMIKAKEFKESSNIYYNVDQFYKSSWEKLLWTLGAIGGLGALLFNKYTNTVKLDIKNSKQEIKEYTNERIKNYEELIANYKKNTIQEVEEKVKNMIESELKLLNDKIQEEDGKLEEIELKMENTQSNLEEMADKIEEIKKIAWMNL